MRTISEELFAGLIKALAENNETVAVYQQLLLAKKSADAEAGGAPESENGARGAQAQKIKASKKES